MASRQAIDRLVNEYGPDTVVEVLGAYLSGERKARMEEVLDRRLSSVAVVIENLYDAHNGAAAIRSMEAFGLTDLHVIETESPFRFAAGVSIGCEKWIGLHRHPDVASCARAVRERGFAVYATLPDAEVDIETVPVDRPIAVLFGNEHEGVTAEAVAACDGAVSIPMHGFTQSFNLSVSVALAMHRLAARRRRFIGAAGDLEVGERAFLRARWYALSVRAAELLLARHVSE